MNHHSYSHTVHLLTVMPTLDFSFKNAGVEKFIVFNVTEGHLSVQKRFLEICENSCHVNVRKDCTVRI